MIDKKEEEGKHDNSNLSTPFQTTKEHCKGVNFATMPEGHCEFVGQIFPTILNAMHLPRLSRGDSLLFSYREIVYRFHTENGVVLYRMKNSWGRFWADDRHA